MEGLAAIPVTILIIAASAFFVSIEFATIAARRTRLEAEAATNRSARAALRNAGEVPVLLAGSQLGITACTLALGAVTEPAVEHAVEPLLDALGLPHVLAVGIAFAFALTTVTFLHLVVGEMAPKSWAISHPERSAMLFAVPMRAFMWVFRPILSVLNEAANTLVRRLGVQPRDEVAIEQSPDDLRQLVEHSAQTGDLDERSSEQLGGALEMSRTTLADLDGPDDLVSVPADATVGDLQERSRSTGHLRVLVEEAGRPEGVVHVRDTITADLDDPVHPFRRDLHEIDSDATVLDALSELRLAGTQIALVRRGEQAPTVVTIADLLRRLMPAAGEAGAGNPGAGQSGASEAGAPR